MFEAVERHQVYKNHLQGEKGMEKYNFGINLN